jgi:hypothetical protein
MLVLLSKNVSKVVQLVCKLFISIERIIQGKDSIDNMLPHGEDFITEYERFNMVYDDYQPHKISNRLSTLLCNCFFYSFNL